MQTRYHSARAELEGAERELERTERLVVIGAASRQELERIRAQLRGEIAFACGMNMLQGVAVVQ